jgi:hypothetical protein
MLYNLNYKKPGKDKKYRQVYLGQGDRRLVGWVENRKAIKGRAVMVEGYDGVWEIITVFTDITVNDDDIKILTDEYRHHRKRTDI